MIWHPITSGDCGSSDAEAVRREIAWYLGRSQNLPEPIHQVRTSKRLTIRKQKQGARSITPGSKVRHHGLCCTERMPTKSNVDKAALPERISLGTFDPYAHRPVFSLVFRVTGKSVFWTGKAALLKIFFYPGVELSL